MTRCCGTTAWTIRHPRDGARSLQPRYLKLRNGDVSNQLVAPRKRSEVSSVRLSNKGRLPPSFKRCVTQRSVFKSIRFGYSESHSTPRASASKHSHLEHGSPKNGFGMSR